MVYQRRYFPALTITTIAYGDKSVTADKLADGAVITPKVGSSAITSGKILDETIQTEDIKAGAVRTSDLGDGAVTSPKLADGAVTTFKYGFESITGSKIKAATIPSDRMVTPPITRPITPGVDTVEIQDGKVTAAKLAGDAVETAKIKDANVTQAKLAAGSVGNTQIDADAVRGTEIQDGAVSEGKIGTDAVVTAKIKDRQVTTDKLIREILAEELHERGVFFDDFFGAVLRSIWAEHGDPGGSVIIENSRGTNALITTQNLINNTWRIDWNGKQTLLFTKKPRLMVRIREDTTTNVKIDVGLFLDANNWILFQADTSIDNNWHASCRVGGVETDVDTGIAISNTYKVLEIEWVGANEVKFYIDGVLKNTIVTNIPPGESEPYIFVETLEAAIKEVEIDYVLLSIDR